MCTSERAGKVDGFTFRYSDTRLPIQIQGLE